MSEAAFCFTTCLTEVLALCGFSVLNVVVRNSRLWIINIESLKSAMKQPHMASTSHAAEADVRKKGYLLKVKVSLDLELELEFERLPTVICVTVSGERSSP